MTNLQKPLVHRAIEIAPECRTNKVIRARLKREGYTLRDIESNFHGKGLREQLKALRSRVA